MIMKLSLKIYQRMNLLFFTIIAGYLFCTAICFGNKQANEQIAILGFHNIVSDQEKQTKYMYNMWVESESRFEQRMAYLYEQGYKTWTMAELYAWKCGKKAKPEKAVVLTFDDGYRSSKEIIAPILKKYGFKGTTFVVGSFVQKENSDSIYLSENDLREQDVMAYYSHTYQLHYQKNHHYAIDFMNQQQLQEDFNQQRNIIDCSYVAYPYGHYNDTVIAVLKENGVKMAFGYHENRKEKQKGDFYTIPRFSVNAYTSMDTMKAMLESE